MHFLIIFVERLGIYFFKTRSMGFNSCCTNLSEMKSYLLFISDFLSAFVFCNKYPNFHACLISFFWLHSLPPLFWKIEAGRQLEAFSLQLVILAIWKQALHICHTQAAIAIEGSPSQEIFRGSTNKNNPDVQESRSSVDYEGPAAVCSQIEKEFLLEVGHAEELARDLEPIDGMLSISTRKTMIYCFFVVITVV